MAEHVYGESRGALVERAIENADDRLRVVAPTAALLRDLVDRLASADARPTVDLLGRHGSIADGMDDFVVASTAADLIATESLTIRTSREPSTNALLLHDEAIVAVVDVDATVGGLVATDDAFLAAVDDRFDERWTAAEEYSLRTPPLSDVYEGLADRVGAAALEDFRAGLDLLAATRDDGGFDEVTLGLLVAAKHDAQLYEVGKWGEDTGIASKATFSRVKTQLEERGLIETERVPGDVGRPRHRLTLSDEYFETADVDRLADAARAMA